MHKGIKYGFKPCLPAIPKNKLRHSHAETTFAFFEFSDVMIRNEMGCEGDIPQTALLLFDI